MSDALREQIIAAIRTVRDPEIPVNIWELGLIYEIQIADSQDVAITMTLTSPNCPVAEMIPNDVKTAVRAVDGIGEVEVSLVWEPTWTAEMMSDAAKLELEFTGHTGPAHLRKDKFTNLTMGRTPKKRP